MLVTYPPLKILYGKRTYWISYYNLQYTRFGHVRYFTYVMYVTFIITQ